MKKNKIPKEMDIRQGQEMTPSEYRSFIERLRAEGPKDGKPHPITIMIEKITIKLE